MSATAVLREEHRAVERMAGVMAAMSEQARQGAEISAAQLRQVGRFLEEFVGCHQLKEERLLFPALMGSDAEVIFGVIGRLVSDHGKGRVALAKIGDVLERGAGDSSNSAPLADVFEDYAVDMRQHIILEESECFDVADRHLFHEVQDFLVEAYDAIEAECIGTATRGELEAMLQGLEAEMIAVPQSIRRVPAVPR